jgi:hypothetical protein
MRESSATFKLRATSMADCGKVVFFWTAGFLPQLKVVDEGTKEIHAVLEGATGREQILPSCSDIRPLRGALGGCCVCRCRGASVEKAEARMALAGSSGAGARGGGPSLKGSAGRLLTITRQTL